MTISDRRKEAARANGAKSRGPVTSEGKAHSSKNATKHGLSSKRSSLIPTPSGSQDGILGRKNLITGTLVLDLESPPRFQKLLSQFEAEYRPATTTERALVAKLTASVWRQMRIWALEKSALDRETERHSAQNGHETPAVQTGLAFQALGDSSRSLHLIHLYESRYERQFHRALDRLMTAKMNKQTQEVVENIQKPSPNEPRPEDDIIPTPE